MTGDQSQATAHQRHQEIELVSPELNSGFSDLKPDFSNFNFGLSDLKFSILNLEFGFQNLKNGIRFLKFGIPDLKPGQQKYGF